MGKTLEKIKDVEYNELVVLLLLYNNKQLWDIFKDQMGLNIHALITIAKNDGLSYKTKEILETFFNDIILTHQSVLDDYEKYLSALKDKGLDKFVSSKLNKDEPVIVEVTPIVKEESPKVIVEKPKVEKKKPNRKLPRRIGKEAINKMIAENGGQSKQIHRAMLASNELKNLYVRLNTRLIKELCDNDDKITDEEYNSIRATITMIKNKIEPILKKK